MVFFVATTLAVIGRVESSDWVDVAIVYIGIEGLADIVGRLRGYGFGGTKPGKDTAI